MSFKMIVFAIIGFLILAGSFSSVSQVETGHRGVKTVFGKVTGEPLHEGIYFNSPFSTQIHQMDIRTHRFDGETTIYTKDVQTAGVKYAVNFSLEGEKTAHLYQTVGERYDEKLIPPVVEGSLKATFGKWEAVEVISNREKLRIEIEAFLKANLAPRGISVERFEITNIDYSDEFEQAVEGKVVAIQSAEQEKNKTVQIQEQANQKIISAKAEAESMRIRADSLSQNRALVDYEAVQKWDGHLPQYVMGNATPFINMTPKAAAQQ